MECKCVFSFDDKVLAEAQTYYDAVGCYEPLSFVSALPQQDPEITGEQKVYKVGETISLNCTSGRSYPPARLRWFVNDVQVHYTFAHSLPPEDSHYDLSDPQVNSYYEDITQQHGLLATVVGLRFEVKPEHIAGGSMVIRCAATISTVNGDVREHVITSFVDNREALLLGELVGHSIVKQSTPRV